MILAIEIGSCVTRAAVRDLSENKVHLVPLSSKSLCMPSVAHIHNEIVRVGEEAIYWKYKYPECFFSLDELDFHLENDSLILKAIASHVINLTKKFYQIDSVIFVTAHQLSGIAGYQSALKNATISNGINNVSFCPFPISMAMRLAKLREDECTLIYDLGHSKTEVSLVQRCDSRYHVISSKVTKELSGLIINSMILQDMLDNVDVAMPESTALQFILNDVQESMVSFLRKCLCNNLEGAIPLLECALDNPFTISQDRLRNLLGKRLSHSLALFQGVLQTHDLNKYPLKNVILVGGGCELPFIEENIRKYIDSTIATNVPVINASLVFNAAHYACENVLLNEKQKGVTLVF